MFFSSVFNLMLQILTSARKEHTTALLMPSAIIPMDRSTAQVFNGRMQCSGGQPSGCYGKPNEIPVGSLSQSIAL